MSDCRQRDNGTAATVFVAALNINSNGVHIVSKYFLLVLMLFVAGIARAAEIQDAPIPEPNYAGIIIFLVLMVGAGVWFMWKVMRNTGDKK